MELLSNETEKQFYEKIEIQANLVQLYENMSLLNHALELIPFEVLSNKVTEREKQLDVKSKKIGTDDLMIIELLKWFKTSFFTWVDVPKCDNCNSVSVKRGMTPATESELRWGANKVELYFCNYCLRSIRFPRYQHPQKLLKTRKGRCGEWANCFTLLCRALGYEARLVYDWNDHVWTEVFSQTQNRWLHCDSCENICDRPLIYEEGWKKDITYVIAFSKDEVQDVTWRYTSRFPDVRNRRNLCREDWLSNCIATFTTTLQSTLPQERKDELKRRHILELVEFLTPPKVGSSSLEGRTSGSVDWRMSRGEYNPKRSRNPFVFVLEAEEAQSKCIHIKYSCALDKYIYISRQYSQKQGWESSTFGYSGLFRKVESDWNTAYIAREEGCAKGLISWKFDFSKSGLVIKTIHLNLQSETFENGNVKCTVLPLPPTTAPRVYLTADLFPLVSNEFEGRTGFIISAQLTGGSGNAAWQHAQLFRQPLNSKEFPFEIRIDLKES